jgi:hypothetical protein
MDRAAQRDDAPGSGFSFFDQQMVWHGPMLAALPELSSALRSKFGS